jgi:TonB family protein
VEPNSVQKENAPSISIAVEPVDESGARKTPQTLAGARALQQDKGASRFTPAKAIQKVTPNIPAALKKNISGEVPVDLRVSIDEEGNIFRTEVLPGNADNRLLSLASDAAKRWRFEPARINSKPVSSKVVLHFMFRNPT